MLEGKYCECTTFTHTETTTAQTLHSYSSSQASRSQTLTWCKMELVRRQHHYISAELTPTDVLLCHKPTNHKSVNKIYNTNNMKRFLQLTDNFKIYIFL